MTDIIKGVFDLSQEILDNDISHVEINENKIEELGQKMLDDGPVVFYSEEPSQKGYVTGIPAQVAKELVANSINYCYWYSSHDIRPNGCSSTVMYDAVEGAFDNNDDLMFETKINNLLIELAIRRFPLLEERKRHLLDLCEGRKADNFITMVTSKSYSGKALFNQMVEKFPGYASDMFLKRASLFFIQLYRRFGWYKDDLMNELFVPADYQVPKILKHFECIKYSDDLEYNIRNNELIPADSIKEAQIRAATIIACRLLQRITKWNVADIDTYLWTKRKLTNEPFHLTLTTAY